METTTANNPTNQSQPTTAVQKIDLTKLPTYDVARNDVTEKLVPYQYGKKGDRQGEVFYSLEQVTPENELKVKQFFGPEWWYKKLNTVIRQAFQQLDTVFTNKGKEPLDIQDILDAAAKLSTRGEPIGVMKCYAELLRKLPGVLIDLGDVTEESIDKAFALINAEATRIHEETKDEDDDSDPVLLEEPLKVALKEALHNAIGTTKADAENANLPMNIIKKLAQATINKMVFKGIFDELKEVNANIVKNTKTRKPRKTREEAAAEEAAETTEETT